MTENPFADLSLLTLAASRTLVGQEYVRSNDAGPDVVLRLLSAEPARRDPTVTEDADRPFSLIFLGPIDPILTQGMHDLDHPEHPLKGLFLVPIGDNGQGPQYQAIFT
jgi:Domain of unknown function (DUF6916)